MKWEEKRLIKLAEDVSELCCEYDGLMEEVKRLKEEIQKIEEKLNELIRRPLYYKPSESTLWIRRRWDRL